MSGDGNSTLIMFTDSYPYGAVAESFVDTELPYLCSVFDKVIILPRSLPPNCEKIERRLPENVLINEGLIVQNKTSKERHLFKLNAIRMTIASKYFYSEIISNFQLIVNLDIFKQIVGYLYSAFRIKQWVIEQIKYNNLDLSNTIFYTYWLNDATTGIGLAKKEYSEITIVSRAPRGDLYEEYHNPQFFPLRYETLSMLNNLFVISDHGYNYLIKKYPKFQSKFKLARLGVEEPSYSTKFSRDGIFRIVSCSYVVPVKRIELLIQALEVLGKKYPKEKFEWVHIGYGPLMEQMEEFAEKSLPSNVSYHFLGFIPDVMKFYEQNMIDVFVNVSSSEGIPVSIMEAQSCGIPVIGTAVGGTPEIVSEDVGKLISENPTPNEIADAIWEVKRKLSFSEKLRYDIKLNWNEYYNAAKNYRNFSYELFKMI